MLYQLIHMSYPVSFNWRICSYFWYFQTYCCWSSLWESIQGHWVSHRV